MKIVVGYSPSDEGRAALEWAKDEARLRGGTLVLVRHVGVTGPEAVARAASAREELEALAAEVTREGIACEAAWEIGPMPAGSAVLSQAREHRAELIVIGIRRRSPVGKLVLGSRSQDILLGADCAVIAVKASDVHP